MRFRRPPRAADAPPPGYARFCALMMPGAAAGDRYRAAMVAQNAEAAAGLAPDITVTQAVAARLKLAALPSLIARKLELVDPTIPEPGEVKALVGSLDPSAPRYWLVTLTGGALGDVTVANVETLRSAIGLPRTMAPYIMLNDLLGGDATVPRAAAQRSSTCGSDVSRISRTVVGYPGEL